MYCDVLPMQVKRIHLHTLNVEIRANSDMGLKIFLL
jgi:hypothetical protein